MRNKGRVGPGVDVEGLGAVVAGNIVVLVQMGRWVWAERDTARLAEVAGSRQVYRRVDTFEMSHPGRAECCWVDFRHTENRAE